MSLGQARKKKECSNSLAYSFFNSTSQGSECQKNPLENSGSEHFPTKKTTSLLTMAAASIYAVPDEKESCCEEGWKKDRE